VRPMTLLSTLRTLIQSKLHAGSLQQGTHLAALKPRGKCLRCPLPARNFF
jgi:hypothetical protein